MNDSEISRELDRARGGDRGAVGALLEGNRLRLERVVRLRLDHRLRGRVDEADVIQDTFLEAAQRFESYLEDPPAPFFLWLRYLAFQRLDGLCRAHLGTHKRNSRLEQRIDGGSYHGASSEALAAQLLGRFTTPSQAAVRAEMKARLTAALESLDPGDREVIALRHFEELVNHEAAQVLGIDQEAASKRYLRAIKRLRKILERVPRMSELM